MSAADIFEEICADAYAGLNDFFEVQETGYEGATRFTDSAREASQEYAGRVQADVAEGLNAEEVREREGGNAEEEDFKTSRNLSKDSTAEEVYEAATPVQNQLNNTMREVSEELGYPYEDVAQKSIESMREKVERYKDTRPGYSFSDIDDMTRANVMMNDFSEIPAVLDAFDEREIPYEAKNVGPTSWGYRGFHANWENEDGIKTEVQLTTPEHWKTKKESDALYEKWRAVKDTAVLSEDAKKQMKADKKLSKKMWHQLEVPPLESYNRNSSLLASREYQSSENETGSLGLSQTPLRNSNTSLPSSIGAISNTRPSSVIQTSRMGNPPFSENVTGNAEENRASQSDNSISENGENRNKQNDFVNNSAEQERVNKIVDKVNLNVDAETESASPNDVLYSRNSWLRSEYVTERDQAAKELAKALGVSVKKAKDYIDQINGVAKMIADDQVRLDYRSHAGLSSFVSNVEYGGSFDFSTLCKKRRLMTGTFQMIQRALPNTALTPMDVLKVRQMMKDAGFEVSCGLCYVEGSRANMGQFTKAFIELYQKYHPGEWAPTIAEIITPDGQEEIRVQHPEVYSEWEYFWNHHGQLRDGDPNLFASQQKPKLYQLRTEYNNEILDNFKKDSTIEQKNKNGGVRFQSFSDFEIVHLIDMMQIVMDMSKVGLAGQAYTKVPDFALALGNTGMKINLSLITKGLDENGQLIFDDVEGMPHDEAFRIRDMYSKNVGTILVTYTDDQLLAAMADDRIDFIIPFHRSQWKKSQYGAMGLPANTKDYTYQQNEKYIKPQYHEYRGRQVLDKAKNYMPNEYWDFTKTGKENAEAYLQMCAENNKRPKFYKLLQNNGDGSYSLKADGSTDGYWKLLIDFKMYDNDGVGSPQLAVRPDFNMDEAARMLKEYQGGHEQFPGATGIAEQFVKEYKEEHAGAEFSRNRKISQDAQKEISYQKMDLEQKLMEATEKLKIITEERDKALQALSKAQRDMMVSKEKRALESSVQKVAAKLLKDYDVYADDKDKYNDLHYEISKTLEQMRNIVLNVKDPEIYERELRRSAVKLTDKIISGMRRMKSTDSDTYQELRTYLRAKPGITLSEKDRADMKDYNGFRKRNMGWINLTNNGIPVDTAYQELQSLYGEGYFPSDITHPADQLFQIEDIVRNLAPVYESFSTYEIAEMKEYMASDIENEIIDLVMSNAIKTVPQTAMDKVVEKFEKKMAGMEKSYQDRLEKMQAENQEKINKIVDRERESRTKAERRIRDYYNELNAERRARRADSDARTRLLKIGQRLKNKKLPTPSKDLIQQYIGDMDVIAKSITRQKLDRLADLKLWYDTEKANNPDFIADPRTEAQLQRLSQWRISELSIDEVKSLTEVLLNIENEIRTQRYLIEAADKRDIYIQGEETMRNIHNSTGVKAGALGTLDRLFVNGTLSPVRAMHRITGYNESDPMYKATKELSDGQRAMFDYEMRAGQMFTEWTEDKAFVRSITGKNAQAIEIQPGVYITPDMRMSLYLHVKNDENLRHIAKGGITIPDMKLYRKGDMAEAYNRGKTIKLTRSQIDSIINGMSEKEKAFADQAAKYFNGMSQKEINRTSEYLKGYSLAEVKNYSRSIRIRTSRGLILRR